MGIISSLWGHFIFHSKNIALWVAGIIFFIAFFGWIFNFISIVDFLNITLVAALVGVTALYVKATNKLVVLNARLINESRKDRRLIYLEKGLDKIYVPLYEYLVRDENRYVDGDDEPGRFLSSEMGTIAKKDIKFHLYLADENLREPLREILESDGKHRVSKNIYDGAKCLINDGLNKYICELEEITKYDKK